MSKLMNNSRPQAAYFVGVVMHVHRFGTKSYRPEKLSKREVENQHHKKAVQCTVNFKRNGVE